MFRNETIFDISIENDSRSICKFTEYFKTGNKANFITTETELVVFNKISFDVLSNEGLTLETLALHEKPLGAKIPYQL